MEKWRKTRAMNVYKSQLKFHHFCSFVGARIRVTRFAFVRSNRLEAASMWSVKTRRMRMRTSRISMTEPHNKTKPDLPTSRNFWRLLKIFSCYVLMCFGCCKSCLIFFMVGCTFCLRRALFFGHKWSTVPAQCIQYERINLLDGIFLNLLFLIINKSIYTHFM